jgi:hypothetical protein
LQQRRREEQYLFLSIEKSNFHKFTDWILAINKLKKNLCLVVGRDSNFGTFWNLSFF